MTLVKEKKKRKSQLELWARRVLKVEERRVNKPRQLVVVEGKLKIARANSHKLLKN